MWTVVAVSVTVLITWAYATTQRLDRLHIRLDRSRDALQAALDRRCAVIAACYPDLASRARRVEEVRLRPRNVLDRLAAEDELRAALERQEASSSGKADLADADTRVSLALRFYNEAVADTRALRLNPVVRTLRLGGTAAMPQFCALRHAPESSLEEGGARCGDGGYAGYGG
ncbi:hypothetical protein [Corynebacterium capitovis]|uniref:hypothetical protein n=1 Tax=Corynebacterium capitovis TaxID=131081 RepID=UPI0003A44AA2|nr:hypothetical protein [Corynebacterium capitovis]